MPRSARREAWLLALPCLVALAAGCGGAASAASVQETRSFTVGERRVEVRVEDHVGVVFDEAADDRIVGPLVPLIPAEARHAPPARGARGLEAVLHRVQPADKPDLDALVDLAHDLLKRNAGSVEHAGVVVRLGKSTEPVLMTHEIVVQFVEQASADEVAAVLLRHGLAAGERSRFVANLMLALTAPESDDDALEACARLSREPLVDYCEPNFVHAVEYTSAPDPIDDPLLPRQWHHDNLGADGGSFDADIDSVKAWQITTGSPEVVIAVLEDGFDAEHADLAPNLWSHPDDPSVHGWDFEDDDADVLGDPGDRGATSHGTAVAGCAGARGGNGIGVTGSSPLCSLMLLRRRAPTDYFRDAEAISWAWNLGADVITNSWTYAEGSHVPEVVKRALADAMEYGRGGLGAVVLFATRNMDVDVAAIDDIAAVPDLLTVGSVTNTDQRQRACGSGPPLDVLGPSRFSSSPNYAKGTLDVVTTDWRGMTVGYNDDATVQPEKDAGWPHCPEDLSDTSGDYTACFGGTSAATPIVAGVVGLVLSVAPELEREEIHRLLRDTTDRVENSEAAYDPRTGRSSNRTHGYGRVNAFEAVRLVAPGELGGRGGVDVFARDHDLDWGNTERPSSFLFEKERGTIGPWASPDVRVDAPPLAGSPTTAATFDALALEDAAPGAVNRVVVRVRNRGPAAAGTMNVTALWTESALVLPPLPEGFWSGDAPGANVPASGPPGTWRSLGTKAIPSVPYSSGAGLEDGLPDAAQVVELKLTAPTASLVEAGAGAGAGEAAEPGAGAGAPAEAGPSAAPGGLALLVLVDGEDDRAGGDAPAGTLDVLELVELDNNVALLHRRVVVAAQPVHLTLSNPLAQDVEVRIAAEVVGSTTVTLRDLASGTDLALGDPIQLAAGAELPLRVRLSGAGRVDLQRFDDGVLAGGMELVLLP